ncbi:hypothetical protein MJO28_006549 [Puccinia striiformis f. sp. tritici]|uniref:Uncharacterized protein n=1 Tax=Puccinia striiformis f. sp. tritici TaxID=168172 RepID=A0ACC0EH64_9BASI|nr:hypothetical protein MJO28_006549 [Puccinia striiformis f. sp. tritici]
MVAHQRVISSEVRIALPEGSDWAPAFDGLEHDILPRLNRQIESLSEQLDLSELRIDTTRKLESISELQVELDHSLYHLIPFAYLLMRPGLSSNWGVQTEDNHREDLKEFRIGVLFSKVVSLFRDICALFQSSAELILHLKISPTRASYKILMRLPKLVNQPQTKLDYNYDTESEEDGGVHDDSDDSDDSDDDSWNSEAESPSESATELARSAIPIIKLCRLFFSKLSRVSRDEEFKMDPYFTEMSSNQLERLTCSVEHIRSSSRELYKILHKSGTIDRRETIRDLDKTTSKMILLFDSTILLLIVYVIPSMVTLPQHTHPSLKSHHPLKT